MKREGGLAGDIVVGLEGVDGSIGRRFVHEIGNLCDRKDRMGCGCSFFLVFHSDGAVVRYCCGVWKDHDIKLCLIRATTRFVQKYKTAYHQSPTTNNIYHQLHYKTRSFIQPSSKVEDVAIIPK